MLISDLPIELQELVHKRQIEQGNDGAFDGDLTDGEHKGNFRWRETPEGASFWDLVDDGEDMLDDEFYPKKLIIEIY